MRFRPSTTLITPRSDHDLARRSVKGTARAFGLALALGLLCLAGCAPVTTTITTEAPARPAFTTRLRHLSTQPTILRAAQHRLALNPNDPSDLGTIVQTSPETHQSVRSVLAGDVDDVVIVAWLVSFGAMGAWTAFNPDRPERVNIPVSDIPKLVASSDGALGVYRLRDQKHLMLVYPVVAGDAVVGAVGFVLDQAYTDPALEAQAAPLA